MALEESLTIVWICCVVSMTSASDAASAVTVVWYLVAALVRLESPAGSWVGSEKSSIARINLGFFKRMDGEESVVCRLRRSMEPKWLGLPKPIEPSGLGL